MFQSYTDKSETKKSGERLRALRAEMQSLKLDAFLVPHADEYQNEYLPEMAERLAWLTGFTGSAGFCIVTLESARVFVDGRYTLQAQKQLDQEHFSAENLITLPPAKWLEDNLGKDQVVGFDPWLLTRREFKSFEKAVTKAGGNLKAVENPIDKIWTDQPSAPLESVAIHELDQAGKLARDKIEDMQAELVKADADACLITDPTSICWLFNIRGSDVAHTPLTLARLILPATGLPRLFIDKRKLPTQTEAYLTQLADLFPPNQLDEELEKISAKATIQIDPGQVPVILTTIIEKAGGTLAEAADPAVIAKACKNETELEGTREAHLRDGVAMAKFLFWIDRQTPGSITEVEAAKKLEQIRIDSAKAMGGELLDIAFDTISGAGPHSAIPHYRVSDQSNRVLEPDSIYLVDSGGQYIDGTTDITRTVTIGTPPPGAVRDNTLVLKGHIAIALARFPKGTRGMDIDPLARVALWREGKDFAHGTGHGIGSYLSVHEGPQRIARTGTQELLPGMILSNEPGYYRDGQYGIRIENLIIVKPEQVIEDGNTPVMGFETITIAPIDLRLVDPTLLEDDELHWLNAYHGWVYRKLVEHLDEEESQWLRQATLPIARELPAASA